MTTKNTSEQNSARSSGSKTMLLLLAGVGGVIALLMIGLGLYLWLSSAQPATDTAPTSTSTPPPPTATEQPSPLPEVVIIIPTHTPTPPADSTAAAAGDTLTIIATVTRAVTNTPTPPPLRPQKTRPVAIDGTIELIAPDNNIQIGDSVEFKWRWLEDKGCADPPDGYAFEIRVWRDNDSAGPRGAMDAKVQKPNISCDPATGIRAFTINGIKTVPGFEGSSEGRFRWDVALVQLEPYEPKIFPPFRLFFTN